MWSVKSMRMELYDDKSFSSPCVNCMKQVDQLVDTNTKLSSCSSGLCYLYNMIMAWRDNQHAKCLWNNESRWQF